MWGLRAKPSASPNLNNRRATVPQSCQRKARPGPWAVVRGDYFDHVAPDGSSAGERAQRFGYPWRRIRENIAAGQATPREVVEGWIKSSVHRSAMLDSHLVEAGVGYIYLSEDVGRARHHHYWALSLGQR